MLACNVKCIRYRNYAEGEMCIGSHACSVLSAIGSSLEGLILYVVLLLLKR